MMVWFIIKTSEKTMWLHGLSWRTLADGTSPLNVQNTTGSAATEKENVH